LGLTALTTSTRSTGSNTSLALPESSLGAIGSMVRSIPAFSAQPARAITGTLTNAAINPRSGQAVVFRAARQQEEESEE